LRAPRKRSLDAARAGAGAGEPYETEAAEEGEEGECEEGGEEGASGWGAAVRSERSAEVARAALRAGASCLDDGAWTALEAFVPVFFRATVSGFAHSLLLPDGDVVRAHTRSLARTRAAHLRALRRRTSPRWARRARSRRSRPPSARNGSRRSRRRARAKRASRSRATCF